MDSRWPNSTLDFLIDKVFLFIQKFLDFCGINPDSPWLYMVTPIRWDSLRTCVSTPSGPVRTSPLSRSTAMRNMTVPVRRREFPPQARRRTDHDPPRSHHDGACRRKYVLSLEMGAVCTRGQPPIPFPSISQSHSRASDSGRHPVFLSTPPMPRFCHTVFSGHRAPCHYSYTT